MKKFGFTLAEVLVTIGIIGIIAALTMPTFTQNTQKAKIGPKLAKARAVFEQAALAVLDDAQVDALSDALVTCSDDATTTQALIPNSSSGSNNDEIACFWYNMGHHMKGSISISNQTVFDSTDGVSYLVVMLGQPGTGLYAHQKQVGNLIIDINGLNNLPDANGRDFFYFQIRNDGSLMPWGSSQGSADNAWTIKCKADEVPENAAYCAGHIFENNLKVLYK